MLRLQIKPINKWIGTETKNPGWSRFDSTYSKTLKQLEKELEHAGAIASTVQLEMFIDQKDLRLDGELRANAKPFKEGVILSFSVRKADRQLKTVSYPCDTYCDWQDNLRAITLSLEKLRAVSRYGVFDHTDMLGRLSLGAASNESSFETAVEFFAEHSLFTSAQIRGNVDAQKKAFRQTAAKFHPDNQETGNADKFRVAQSMKTIVGV